MMTDYCKTGETVTIPKLPGNWMRLPDDIRYDYKNKMCTCPVCKDDAAGVPWNGWFTCESHGCCVALVDTGEVFVSVKPV